MSAIVNHSFQYPDQGTPGGYPFPGKTVLIFDENRRRLGPNQIGEIAVKSRYLNLEYWNRDDLTNTKFLPDPDGGDEPIYLTGDLGKQLSDGFLIHLGRKDLMVKIRGYRVNLSEVEKRLLEHPKVKEAGVAVWDREPGDK